MPDDLRFETLDPHATDEASLSRLAAYADCWGQAFVNGRFGERARQIWLEGARADDVTLRAAYDTGTLRPAVAPVATYSSWLGALNVGGERTVGLHMISDVTVEPTHRRRGILRRLVTDDLAAAVGRGAPLAALTATEATIYGRFGFGAATRRRHVRVGTGSRFVLRHAPRGRVEVLDPAPAYAAVRAVDAAVLATSRGAVARPAFHAAGDEGRFDRDTGEVDRRTRVAVVLDETDRPTGYARFVPTDHPDRPGGEARVRLVHALDAESYLRLWQQLGTLDLMDEVVADVRVDDLLDLALTDPRLVRTERVRDHLWLRVLDPVAALEARPWREDGSVVLGVDDPLGHAAGRFRVTTRAGSASVQRCDDALDVSLDAETLASTYLGDRSVTEMATAGRVTGPGVAAYAAMADHAGPAPWTTTDF